MPGEPVANILPLAIESLGDAETRASFRVGESWSRTNSFNLKSGVLLNLAVCQYEPPFAFAVVQPAAEIELVVSKGAVVVTRALDGHGHDHHRAGSALQLGSSRRAVPLQVRATGEAKTECVSISMSERRLGELLGVSQLPAAFRAVTESEDPYPLVSQAMTPRLFRSLDEMLNSNVRGPSRLLWHEAKCLELIALTTDELIETAEANSALLSAHDIERLERVRRCLVEHLESPPTLAALARDVGFNETKLKAGFRILFGTSVFACLRHARMEEARRLLFERHLNVTEVASRVGYANPSKFAAAFRRHFGVSPSTLL